MALNSLKLCTQRRHFFFCRPSSDPAIVKKKALYLEEDQVRVIHHSQLPEGLVEFGAGEARGRGSNGLLRGGVDGLAASEPAGLGRSWGSGGSLIAGLTLEGGRGGLIELSLAVKDIVETDPELLELLGLLGGQMAEAALGGKNGLDVGGGHD